ncbi:MAG: hypothetical protein IJ693_02080 [Bacteroidaceae bacterium]|nr:hypothetical protein [Bacteroidaceae bacterium]
MAESASDFATFPVLLKITIAKVAPFTKNPLLCNILLQSPPVKAGKVEEHIADIGGVTFSERRLSRFVSWLVETWQFQP